MDEIERLFQIGADKTSEGEFDQAIKAYKKVISICDQNSQAVLCVFSESGTIRPDN